MALEIDIVVINSNYSTTLLFLWKHWVLVLLFGIVPSHSHFMCSIHQYVSECS